MFKFMGVLILSTPILIIFSFSIIIIDEKRNQTEDLPPKGRLVKYGTINN